MRRREFIVFFGATAWPFAARAQQSEQVRHIAALMNIAADDPEASALVGAFSQGLAEFGLDHRAQRARRLSLVRG
jgi:putative ABC transport system substrate-binding protein